MSLAKRNGLYYTTISAVGVDSIDPSLKPSANHTIYYHSHHPDTCDDISIETTCTPPSLPVTYESHQTPQPRINQFASMPPRTQPFSVPTPKCGSIPPLIDDYVPKCKQIETDLWQARLGHCSDWQLKVLPMSADGLPSRFHPHPFASYDHYNQARVRKRAATRGKHPSRATDKRQRWLMDFGFLRASTTDFSRPDKSRDRVVTSFDGYNAYLVIVDEYTKYVWVYLCVSKDPPIALIELHLDQFGTRGIHIRCDQGGELAGCHDFITAMAARGHIVEPTGADSPDQNKGAEKWNDTFGVTVRVLLYGSGLPAMFWSAALLHAVYLHNRRVHKSTLMTPFEAWHGFKPDLRLLRVFGSRVCIKRTGKRRSKLDRHDFSGIFLGYTATNENIRYIDVKTRVVKTSHHAIFDEAWYLQPKRPPFAQMLYDVGLEPDLTCLDLTATTKVTPYPPLPSLKPPPVPTLSTRIPLPLRASTPPDVFQPTLATTSIPVPPFDLSTNDLPPKRLEHDMILEHDITRRDIETVYLSPSSFLDAFEEVFNLRYFDATKFPTAGMECECEEKN
jgi:hypothetical protein